MRSITCLGLRPHSRTCHRPTPFWGPMSRSEVLYNCSLFGWEADCRRGYIRKAFPKDYPGLEFSDAVRIDILPEEFTTLEKAIREMRKCEKFYQCLADRDQGKVKHCYENDRRWR
jgi:hypothetical protein